MRALAASNEQEGIIKHRTAHKDDNCIEKVDGNQCKYYHHPLLHKAKKKNPPTIASVLNNSEAMLPIILSEQKK